MPTLSYKIIERRNKLHTKTYLILCLVLFVSMGLYGFKKWQQYDFSNKAVAQNQEYLVYLRKDVANEKVDYENMKKQFEELDEDMDKQLKSIFPNQDDYTGLTRQFNIFEKQLAKINNPFEISSIDYQTPSPAENYSILPVRMNIRSSSENFTKFLHLIENSGSLSNNNRLMDISSVRLNFEQSDEGEKSKTDLINFSVQINAYFQK